MNLDNLIQLPEGKTLEFRSAAASSERFIRTVVAFANTAGGRIIVGVEEPGRRVVGVSDPLTLELRLSNLIADLISPRLIPDISLQSCGDICLLDVEIHKGTLGPYFSKREGRTKGVYVRVGSTNRVADSAMTEEIRRSQNNICYDEQPVPGCSRADLNLSQVEDHFQLKGGIKDAQLQSLGILVSSGRRLVPSIGGYLLFGRSRLDRFPDAWIYVATFEGVDKSTILDSRELTGPLLSTIDESVEFIKRNMSRAAIIRKTKRFDRWDIPLTVLREAIVNAVVHADYSQTGSPLRVALFADRLEIESPGLLPFGLTFEDIGRGVSKLRNRVIGRVCKELGYIEQWGSGIQRMVVLSAEAGLKAPMFEEIGTHFRVTLSREKVAAVKTDALDKRIIALVKSRGQLGTAEIAAAVSLTPRATRTRLARLIERGALVVDGSGERDPNRRYRISGD